MATTIEDIAFILKVLAEYDGLDLRMTPESPLVANVKDYPSFLSSFKNLSLGPAEKVGSGIKIGLLKVSFHLPNISTQVRDCVYNNANEFFSLA
jgi:amidase